MELWESGPTRFLHRGNECRHTGFHISALCFIAFINNHEVALSILGISIKGKVHPGKHVKYGSTDRFMTCLKILVLSCCIFIIVCLANDRSNTETVVQDAEALDEQRDDVDRGISMKA